MGAPVVLFENTSHAPRIDDLQTLLDRAVTLGNNTIGLWT